MPNALQPWNLHSPGEVMNHVATATKLRDGDIVVATVTADDGGARDVIDVTTIHSGDQPTERHAQELIRAHANHVAGPCFWDDSRRSGDGGWSRPTYVLVTVVCRTGVVMPSPAEFFWLMAWRYSNHLANAFDGDIYAMTEHGWTGYLDQRAGMTPTIERHRAMSIAPGPS